MLALDSIVGVFVWLVGLCVGSFLNVVIYRMPRGLSVAEPRWSFCPSCKATLAWYDNLPVVGWLALRGRCRSCRAAISPQYPIVEAVTGLAFALVYHLLFVAQTRVGLENPHLPTDAALLAAWLTLAAALIVGSTTDLLSYMIDVPVLNAATAVAIVLMAAWPRGDFYAVRAETHAAAAAAAAFLACVVMLWLTLWRHGEPPHEETDDDETLDEPAQRPNVPGVLFPVALLVAASLWLIAGRGGDALPALAGLNAPTIAGVLLLFIVMIAAGCRPREVDEELHEAIEEEAPEARRVVLGELAWLSPAILAGAIVWLLLAYVPAAANAWSAVVRWSPGGGFTPVGGAVFAMHGAALAATAGWLLRIVFTLVFGREAFGVGDIYILSAAGAAAGWDVALLGLPLAVGFALLGWLAALAIKRSAMIPFGPPMAIGFVAALALSRPGAWIGQQYAEGFAEIWSRSPKLLWLLGGAALIACVFAVVVARLVRRLVERT